MNDRRYAVGEIIKVSTAAFSAGRRHMDWDKYIDAEVLESGPTSAGQVYVCRRDGGHTTPLYVFTNLIASK